MKEGEHEKIFLPPALREGNKKIYFCSPSLEGRGRGLGCFDEANNLPLTIAENSDLSESSSLSLFEKPLHNMAGMIE